jgi:hypothetical protein
VTDPRPDPDSEAAGESEYGNDTGFAAAVAGVQAAPGVATPMGAGAGADDPPADDPDGRPAEPATGEGADDDPGRGAD